VNKKKQKNFVNLELGDIVPGTVRSSLTCSPGEGKRQVAGIGGPGEDVLELGLS